MFLESYQKVFKVKQPHPVFLHSLISCHFLSPSPLSGSSCSDFLHFLPELGSFMPWDIHPRNSAWHWNSSGEIAAKSDLLSGYHLRPLDPDPTSFVSLPTPLDCSPSFPENAPRHAPLSPLSISVFLMISFPVFFGCACGILVPRPGIEPGPHR